MEREPHTEAPVNGTRSLAFLLALGISLATMGAVVIEHAYPLGPLSLGGQGEIRPVPAELLRSQIHSGRLSEREAEHWRVYGHEPKP